MTIEIGMLLFPGLTQLDLTGPHEVLSRVPDTRVRLIARTLDPVRAESGMRILPDVTYADVPQLDIVFAPGGSGQIAAAEDGETLAFLRRIGPSAQWIASACTGSLLLGAAGLLDGYRAATHWAFMDLLPLVGATAIDARVVTDRNRITGGGVTAGLDIALTIAATLCGREEAEKIQLMIEYDPHPPFQSGHPNVARRELVAEVRDTLTRRHTVRREQLERLTQRT